MEAKVEQGDGRTDVTIKEEQKTKKVKGDQSYTIKAQENEGTFSVIKDGNKNGYKFSYDNKNKEGKGRKVGDIDNSDTTTKGKKLTASITTDNDGNFEMKAKNEDSNKKAHKIKRENFETETSRTTSHNTEVSMDVTTKNGQTTSTLGISDSQGTKYSASAKIDDNYKAEASAGNTQIKSGQISLNNNGISANGRYENQYDAQANVQLNHLKVEAKASASDSTYGGGSVQVKDGQVNANVNVGKEYKANANVNINGNNIASIDASAKGEANANVEINKNKISAQAGVDAQAGGQASFGKTEVQVSFKFDFHFGFTFDFKSGLHFDIGGKGFQAEGHIIDKETGKDTRFFNAPGTPSYILYRKRRIKGKKKVKNAQKNKIIGQICRPSRR